MSHAAAPRPDIAGDRRIDPVRRDASAHLRAGGN